jgi:hypothetical protein
MQTRKHIEEAQHVLRVYLSRASVVGSDYKCNSTRRWCETRRLHQITNVRELLYLLQIRTVIWK